MIFERADDFRRIDEMSGNPPQIMQGKTLGM